MHSYQKFKKSLSLIAIFLDTWSYLLGKMQKQPVITFTPHSLETLFVPDSTTALNLAATIPINQTENISGSNLWKVIQVIATCVASPKRSVWIKDIVTSQNVAFVTKANMPQNSVALNLKEIDQLVKLLEIELPQWKKTTRTWHSLLKITLHNKHHTPNSSCHINHLHPYTLASSGTALTFSQPSQLSSLPTPVVNQYFANITSGKKQSTAQTSGNEVCVSHSSNVSHSVNIANTSQNLDDSVYHNLLLQ
jgi:hypothetical protein